MPEVDELGSELDGLENRRDELQARIQFVKSSLSGLAYPARTGNGTAKKERAALLAELPGLESALIDLEGDINATGALLGDAQEQQAQAELREATDALATLEAAAINAWLRVDDIRSELAEAQRLYESAVKRTHDAAALARSLGAHAEGFNLPVVSDRQARRELLSRLELLQPMVA